MRFIEKHRRECYNKVYKTVLKEERHLKKSDFYFDLPQELIAQTPLERRDGSRLLLLDKVSGEIEHHHFYELPDFLNPGDCLVLNDSRVLPARLIGTRSTGGSVELVLLRDAAYELGGGANDAVNFTCVTSDSSLVPADEVLLYGPDMKEIKGDVPFARLVILGVKDIDVEKKDAAYAAIRNIEFVKYHVFPDGYMMRVSPESSREQIRVSKKAVKKGISFYKVGCDFIKQYKKNPNITNVRVIFVTAPEADYPALRAAARKVTDITRSLSTILDGIPTDCDSCGLREICDEVEGMRELHFGKEHHTTE